jgi:hypothetical protein
LTVWAGAYTILLCWGLEGEFQPLYCNYCLDGVMEKHIESSSPVNSDLGQEGK